MLAKVLSGALYASRGEAAEPYRSTPHSAFAFLPAALVIDCTGEYQHTSSSLDDGAVLRTIASVPSPSVPVWAYAESGSDEGAGGEQTR